MLQRIKANLMPDFKSVPNSILNGAKLGTLVGIVVAAIIIAFT